MGSGRCKALQSTLGVRKTTRLCSSLPEFMVVMEICKMLDLRGSSYELYLLARTRWLEEVGWGGGGWPVGGCLGVHAGGWWDFSATGKRF